MDGRDWIIVEDSTQRHDDEYQVGRQAQLKSPVGSGQSSQWFKGAQVQIQWAG